jgi:glucuronate isomerase
MTASSLSSEIYGELESIPLVDVHEHLNPLKLSHTSFEDIIFYHYIVTELVSAGMSRNEFEKREGVDKLLYALPYFKYIRNTTTFWCLKQIIKDLYGFDAKALDESNWHDIAKALNSSANNEERASEVLIKRSGVRKSFLTLSPSSEVKGYNKEVFVGVLRIDSLISYLSKDSLKSLEGLTSIDVSSTEGLDLAIEALFKRFSESIVAVALSPLPEELYRPVKPSEILLPLKDLLQRGALTANSKSLIASYILIKFLELCNEYKKALQIMLGIERPVLGASPPDYAITRSTDDQLQNLVKLFAMYPNVKFDVFLADARLLHPITVIAKNYQNVYVSGYWWYAMYPSIIKDFIRIRLEMLPYNKFNGFFSDAYVADWVYGKAVLAKTQLAHVLAEMVYEGYIDKSLAIEIAHAVLHKNAESIYNL